MEFKLLDENLSRRGLIKGVAGAAGFYSPEQMERCARTASEMAMKTVELLNLRADGTFEAKTKAQGWKLKKCF